MIYIITPIIIFGISFMYLWRWDLSSIIIKDLQYAITTHTNSVSRIHEFVDYIEINGHRYRFCYFPEAAPHEHLFIFDHKCHNKCIKYWIIKAAEHRIEEIIMNYYKNMSKRGAYVT